jgi:hypothetical protein
MDDDGSVHCNLQCRHVSDRILSATSNIYYLCAMYNFGGANHIRDQFLTTENLQVLLPSINQDQRAANRAAAYFSRSTRWSDHSSKSDR